MVDIRKCKEKWIKFFEGARVVDIDVEPLYIEEEIFNITIEKDGRRYVIKPAQYVDYLELDIIDLETHERVSFKECLKKDD